VGYCVRNVIDRIFTNFSSIDSNLSMKCTKTRCKYGIIDVIVIRGFRILHRDNGFLCTRDIGPPDTGVSVKCIIHRDIGITHRDLGMGRRHPGAISPSLSFRCPHTRLVLQSLLNLAPYDKGYLMECCVLEGFQPTRWSLFSWILVGPACSETIISLSRLCWPVGKSAGELLLSSEALQYITAEVLSQSRG
jgi:hypothetical protein